MSTPAVPATPAAPAAGTEPVVPATPAAPAAPVAAPASLAVEAAAVPATPTFTKTGNAVYDNALDLVAKSGLDPAKLSDEFSKTGAVSADTRKAMVEKLGEAQTAVLEAAVKAEHTGQVAKAQAKVDAVFDVLGEKNGREAGKELWGKIAEWSKTEASGLSKEDAAKFNSMLAEGGLQAELAAKALKERYMAAPNVSTPPNLIHGDATGAPAGLAPISRAQYTEEKRKAMNSRDAAAVELLEKRARYTMEHKADLWRPVFAGR